ncbi:carboxypeptidase-like regulatory domain-containing protein [Tenacibaculum tangerinum]|uniref:Carboxypeptidase-like regulatory domain-containing protein n=1 Tax=Tenacibaculum tangerinum TaxID=3038772 RepID=A0ABY8L1S6_9FLAO|nr:carboxypeptidase-like regulatory domain-containing protein [Tenacibaculum tangerinum]WGH75246.1 carboxypeptidase-like regulatory domain-containing protein [Tenacibaculum tangerinum]
MKKGLILLLLLVSSISFSQIVIKGSVVSERNEPLEGASVYFNNTTKGTITNAEGKFELKIKEGYYTLVISFLGYATKQLLITPQSKNKNLHITLKEDSSVLNEVVIRKTIYDDNWKYNLTRFKQTFLGRTKLAQTCKIVNEKDLHFEYSTKTNTLTAFARKPLTIKHQGLGYIITYDLVDFTLKEDRLFFSGFARYKNLRKNIRRKWKQNRLEAYNGSQMHFLRSLTSKKLKEDGFVVNQFKRVPNSDRPSEEKIKFAREFFKLYSRSVNLSKKITHPKTTLDSVIVTLQKAKLPKYRDYLYQKNVPYEDIITYDNKTPYLSFKDYLMVIYTQEPEEENYVIGMFGKRRKANGVQTSNIVLLEGKAQIDIQGVLMNPEAVFNEGYWGFEAFANMLPLDYQPTKN